jgi:hypothetical protein
MKQIIQNLKNGETILEEVPAPGVKAGHVLIRSTRSLVSLGTEKMLVEFGKGSLIAKAKAQPDKVKQVLEKIQTEGLFATIDNVRKRLDEPLPLGYCNVGKIVVSDEKSVISEQRSEGRGQKSEVSSQRGGFSVGDRVVSNGPHAEYVCVSENLCAKIPDNVDDEEAAFTVIGSIGLQGIRLCSPTFGETIVVFGLGLIGLITAQLLKSSGCRVIGIDIDAAKLKLAEKWGVDTVC